MKISKNDDLDIIRVFPNGGNTKDVYIDIENDLDLSRITLTISEARQIADEILNSHIQNDIVLEKYIAK